MNFLDEYFKYEIGTEISGLTNELNIFFVEKLSQKYDRNIIVLTSSLFEANKIYDELVKIHENTLLFPMDDFLSSMIIASSPELKYKRLETLDKIKDNKKYIIVSENDDLEDIRTFINLNDKLKTVKIMKYSNELLTTILDELISNKKKNIRIEIEEKNNDLKTIFNSVNYLKKVNKDYLEENNIAFKLNYSDAYKKKNLFKEINFKMFTTIIVFIMITAAVTLMLDYYAQFKDNEKVEKELVDINKIIDDASSNNNLDENDRDIDYIDNREETITTTKKVGSSYSNAYYTNYKQVFNELMKKNDDTVGYLMVNNTKINYPVVQASTNSYYLNRDFNKRKNSMGWIFMDYRNNPTNLDKNTIIYGHNIKQGIMFGTLKYALNSSWYRKESNQIITFNTPTKNMKWRIFSIYKIPATEDYLKTEFANDDEYMNFVNMLKSRSLYDFNVKIDASSKILTLSTCFSHTTRHVVHAVLIEEEEIKNQE